jgi:hypothetical protein
MISVQVYHIVSYLDCLSKHTKENLKIQQVFVQGSISHTPEGTDTERAKDIFVERNTSNKVHGAAEGITPVTIGRK